MKTIQVTTFVPCGISGRAVTITAREGRTGAFPALTDGAARELRLRRRSALQSVDVASECEGLEIEMPRAGEHCDLAVIAVTLAWLGKVEAEALDGLALLGQVWLDGKIRPVRGVLQSLNTAARAGFRRAIVPGDCAAEASHAAGIEVLVAETVAELLDYLVTGSGLPPVSAPEPLDRVAPEYPIHCSAAAMRAVEIAAAGGHPMLLVGPSEPLMLELGRRLADILPPLSAKDADEVTSLYSVAGILGRDGWMERAPFRAPHASTSCAGLVGGGAPIRPGEVSLAHGGVLHLSELDDHRSSGLDAVERALAAGHVDIWRAQERPRFPARAHLVGSVTTGHLGLPAATTRLQRIGLLKRFQVHALVTPAGAHRHEPAASSRARVIAARAIQAARNQTTADGRPMLNAEVSTVQGGEMLPAFCMAPPSPADAEALANAVAETARTEPHFAFMANVVRVARTIADLAGAESITAAHMLEALSLRLIPQSADKAAAA